MKSAMKLLSVLLSVIMVLSLGLTVFADEITGGDTTGGETPAPTPEAETGTITVSGTTEGKTYDIYKIFDLTGSNKEDDEYTNVSYTIDSDWVNFFIGTSAPGKAYLLTTLPDDAELSPLNYNGTVYYINITDDNVADFAADALAWCADNSPAADDSEVAAGDTVEFTDLELGYYLVYPQGATEVADSYASICSLTSTIPDAEVDVKATYPTITKTVDDASVEVGQTVLFTITGKVPDTTGYTAYTYEVTDTMSAGLTFNSTVAEFTVKFGNTSVTVPDTSTGTTLTIANNGFDLKFDMTKYQTSVGETITITYKAVVNDGAVAVLTENKATLSYSNDPQTPASTETTPEVNVQVYSSKIVIDKYDGNDEDTKLKGAEFVLLNSDEEYYKYTAATATAAAKVEWVTSIDDATVAITDEDGAASFEGLEDGTYYLREITAPEGYNLLADDVEVTIAVVADEDTKAVGISVTSSVANNSGTVLPSTGGKGTVLFVAIGAIVALGAGVVLTARKRLYNEG